MSILNSIQRFLVEFDAMMEHARTGAPDPEFRRLPPELRRDLGQPDAGGARMARRGRRG
jgi:hypothetical protein